MVCFLIVVLGECVTPLLEVLWVVACLFVLCWIISFLKQIDCWFDLLFVEFCGTFNVCVDFGFLACIEFLRTV